MAYCILEYWYIRISIIIFQVYDYDGNLTVRIDENSIGKYICRASVKGFREIEASAEVFMKGKFFCYLRSVALFSKALKLWLQNYITITT